MVTTPDRAVASIFFCFLTNLAGCPFFRCSSISFQLPPCLDSNSNSHHHLLCSISKSPPSSISMAAAKQTMPNPICNSLCSIHETRAQAHHHLHLQSAKIHSLINHPKSSINIRTHSHQQPKSEPVPSSSSLAAPPSIHHGVNSGRTNLHHYRRTSAAAQTRRRRSLITAAPQ